MVRFTGFRPGNGLAMTECGTAPLPVSLLDRVGRSEALDQLAAPIEQVLNRVPEGTRRVLHAEQWLGHPLHPAIVHFPLGAWMAAGVMDAARRPDAARWLTTLGVAAALPAAAAGWADWVGLREDRRRIGLVHAATNILGVGLYTGSAAARWARRERLGRALGWAGLAAVSVGGAIGGDLVFRWATGVSTSS
jgi:uncharacterized membrane protein